MAYVLGISWGVLTLIIMLLSDKYYVPRLLKRKSSDTDLTEAEEDNLSRHSKKTIRIVAICSSVFAAISGFCLASLGHDMRVVSGFVALTIVNGVLSCIFITDMQLKIIPNLCSIILLASKVVTSIIDFIQDREFFVSFLIQCVLAGIGCLIFFLIISKVTQGGIGMGDVKILSSIGFLCGIKVVLYSTFFSFVAASLFSLFLVLAKKKKVKDSLPFGPMLWVGFEITALLCLV